MCGILGYYNLRGLPVDRSEEEVTRLRDLMVHRGPDAAGYLEAGDRSWILAHRRLSIIDLSSLGHQPMSDAAGRVHLCYNGEIYNFRELREELRGHGYQFRSTSDTEVLLHLYRHMGIDCLAHLCGMFALIIVDEERRRAVIARDPAGEKPLFYTAFGDTVMIASDPGVISRDRQHRKAINPQGLYYALTMGGVKSPDTLFEGIYKLEPGHCRVIDSGFQVAAPSERYYDYQIRERSQLRDNGNAVEEMDRVLDRSVAQRMISDVPFGVYLSGGIDSALILAYMSQYVDRVNTFSIDPISSVQIKRETGVAHDVARQFKTNHQSVEISDEEFIEILDGVLFMNSGLTMPDAVLITRLSRMARASGVLVIETGEGADELFMGYQGHLDALNQGYSMLAASRGLIPPIVARAACAFGPDAKQNRLAYLVDSVDMRASRLIISDFLYQPYFNYQAKRIVRRYLNRRAPTSKFQTVNSTITSSSPDYRKFAPSTLSFLWSWRYRWGDFLLDRIDRHTMAASVEGRAPFLDPDVVNFGLSLTDDLKVRAGANKYILRKIAEKRVSVEHARLPKRGFGGGNDNMLGPKVCAFMRGKLSASSSYRDSPLMELRRISSPSQLFTVTSFHAWADNWL